MKQRIPDPQDVTFTKSVGRPDYRRSMALGGGIRPHLWPFLSQMLNEFDESSDLGRENRALGHFCENTQEIGKFETGGESGIRADFDERSESNDA